MEENPYEYDGEPAAERNSDTVEQAAAAWAPPDDLRIPAGMGRGYVRHVPLLGILMVLQGLGEGGYALFLAAVTIAIPPGEPSGNWGLAGASWGAPLIYAAMSLALLAIGGLSSYAGIAVRRYRGHTWGIMSLSLGLLAFVGGYLCFPTAVLVSVYGFLVLSNPSVKVAFRLGEAGYAPQQVRRAFET